MLEVIDYAALAGGLKNDFQYAGIAASQIDRI